MKFNYTELSRDTDDNGKRVYKTPEGSFFSVTTILSATADSSGLDAWINWVGKDKAEKIRDQAAGLGSLMHEHLECHLLNESRPGGNNFVRIMAKNMADVIIDKGLSRVSEIWGIEAPLYHNKGYAGTTDLVGIHDGEAAIMDFKTTRKMKTFDMLNDYFCQCVAYMEAHNYLFDTDINKVVIFMVSRDCEYKEFVLSGNELDFYKHQWNNRVDTFIKMNKKGLV